MFSLGAAYDMTDLHYYIGGTDIHCYDLYMSAVIPVQS